jgi:hypothetical protein
VRSGERERSHHGWCRAKDPDLPKGVPAPTRPSVDGDFHDDPLRSS